MWGARSVNFTRTWEAPQAATGNREHHTRRSRPEDPPTFKNAQLGTWNLELGTLAPASIPLKNQLADKQQDWPDDRGKDAAEQQEDQEHEPIRSD